MAVRRPLYYNAGNLQEMTSAMIDQIVAQVSYLYSLSPSVTLSQVSSGGSLGNIADTRLKAGSYQTRVDRFPTAAELQNVQTKTTNYGRIDLTAASTTEPAGVINPLFYSSGNLRTMTADDMYDTFIFPAIDILTNGSTGTAQGGTYRIHTGTSLAGHTLVSSTAVFTDTRANASAYSGSGIPETKDQPTTISNFYLFQIDGGAASSYTAPVYYNASSQIQTFPVATFDTMLQNLVRHAATSKAGYTISYNFNGSGNNRGSGMTNTILNSSTRGTRFVNVNGFSSQ